MASKQGMDKQRVLIIDDDKDIANLFGVVLGMVGFECEVMNTAKEALSRLAQTIPDLVLLDMRLGPELSGEDILFQIRSNPRLKNTRVIVITAYPTLAESVTRLADLTLLKPIEVDQLKSFAVDLGSSDPQARKEYFRDPVTGFYNQEFFETRLEHAFERAKRRPDFIFAVCVIHIDLEQADVAPPDVFDTVLREASGSMRQNLRPTDTISRLSRNKFATLHEELKHPEDIKIIVNRIRTILIPSFRVNNRKYTLKITIGAVTNSKDYKSSNEMFADAELKLADSK
jgi:diguanylate cyclase (GGDEF)-like protein